MTRAPDFNAIPDAAYEDDFRRDAAPPDEPGSRPLRLPSFAPIGAFDVSSLPKQQMIYGDFLARGYTSLTIAPPKVGKSMLALAEAIDIASGAGILTGRKTEPMRVLYLNAEDDLATLQKRTAALCQRYQLALEDVVQRLSLVSTMIYPDLALTMGPEGAPVARVMQYLENEIDRHQLDVVIFDPLADMTRSPETNEAFRPLILALRGLAQTTGVAIHLIHHTRKMQQGSPGSMDDGRGGGALRAGARFNRLLVPMSEGEATRWNVEDHRNYFRIGEIEANHAPPGASRGRWFQKIGLTIANGENMPAVIDWTPPNDFTDITVEMAADVRRQAREAHEAGEPLRSAVQSPDWIGTVIARVCGFPIDEADGVKQAKIRKQRAARILAQWLETDVLQEVEAKTAQRKTVKALTAGSNNPLEVSS